MSFIQWCCERGPKSHVAKEISGTGWRRRREKDNQGVGDFRFINILQLFSIYFFFNYFTLSFFFVYFFLPTTHDIYPHPRRSTHDTQPTTSTHYPRPTTFSYTRGNGIEIHNFYSLHFYWNKKRLALSLTGTFLWRIPPLIPLSAQKDSTTVRTWLIWSNRNC